MRPDDFFAAVEDRSVRESPYLTRIYGLDIAKSSEVPHLRSSRVSSAEYGLCSACGELAPISTGHSRCGSCRKAGRS